MDRVKSDADDAVPKAFNKNMVAYNAQKQLWCEKVGDVLIWRKRIEKRDYVAEANYVHARRVFRDFLKTCDWPEEDINFLRMSIFFGIGPLPEKLQRIRFSEMSFTYHRPTHYSDYYRGRDWWENGCMLTVNCDTYNGITHIPSNVATDLSYVNGMNKRKLISGTGQNLITGIREKIDGELLCVIETISETETVHVIEIGNQIRYSEYSGYGYCEVENGVYHKISGTLSIPQRPYYTLDTVKRNNREGYVILINGVEYKLKHINTYDVILDEDLTMRDITNCSLGQATDSDDKFIGVDFIYEVADDEFQRILAPRYSRIRPEKQSLILAIKSSMTVSALSDQMIESEPRIAPEFAYYSGLLDQEISDLMPHVVGVFNVPKFQALTMLGLQDILIEITKSGYSDLATLFDRLSKFGVLLTIPRLRIFLSICGFCYKSHLIIPSKSIDLRLIRNVTIRKDDELIKVSLGRSIMPNFRSLVPMECGYDHVRPECVMALIQRDDKKILFTRALTHTEYEFSAAGLIKWGEYPRNALAREMTEELGIPCVSEVGMNEIWMGGIHASYDNYVFDKGELFAKVFVAVIYVPDSFELKELGEERVGTWSLENPVPMRHDSYIILHELEQFGVVTSPIKDW